MKESDYETRLQLRTKLQKSPILTLFSYYEDHRSTDMDNQYAHIRLNFRFRDEDGNLAYYSDWDQFGKAYDNLWIGNQMDARLGNCEDQLNHSYGWGLGYRNITCFELSDAERMAKTLRGIENKIAKKREIRGYPDSFRQYVNFIIEAVNCKEFALLHPDNPDYVEKYLDIPSGLNWIDAEIRKHRKRLLAFNPEWKAQQRELLAA